MLKNNLTEIQEIIYDFYFLCFPELLIYSLIPYYPKTNIKNTSGYAGTF